MMESSSSPLAPPARWAAGLLGAFGMLAGIRAVFSPRSYAAAFGFHPGSPTARSADTNPFVAATGEGGNFAAGLALVLCAGAVDDGRAAGLLLLSALVTGACDAATLVNFAGVGADSGNGGSRDGSSADAARLLIEVERRVARRAAWGHIGVTALIAGLGWWMLVSTA